jgi:hypothetical protein
VSQLTRYFSALFFKPMEKVEVGLLVKIFVSLLETNIIAEEAVSKIKRASLRK